MFRDRGLSWLFQLLGVLSLRILRLVEVAGRGVAHFLRRVPYFDLLSGLCSVSSFSLCSVGRQIVNVPSFNVRVESEKHIDFALQSPFGGARSGRVKRKNEKEGKGGDAEDDE